MAATSSSTKKNPPKPRVLISGHLPPPAGGIATYFLALLNSSLPELVDLSFVQTSSQKRTLSQSGRFTPGNFVSAALDIARFTGALIRRRPRVVHISTAFGVSFLKHSLCVWIARLAGCRVLLHPRCSIRVLYLDRSKLWQRYFRLVVRQASGVLALSREWLQLNTITPGCTLYYLPNAIDQAPYRSIAEERLPRQEGGSPVRILYLGYVGQDKGSFDIIRAAKILQTEGKAVRIDIVGDELHPGEKEALLHSAAEAGVNDIVTIHPAAYGSQKLAFFREADIFFYPSYHEGLPNAVLEAMACALPVVATRVGGIPDQVQEGVNGLLVEPGDPAGLAQALGRLSEAPALRKEMQKESYRIAVECYDMETYIPRLAEVYRTIDERRAAPGIYDLTYSPR